MTIRTLFSKLRLTICLTSLAGLLTTSLSPASTLDWFGGPAFSDPLAWWTTTGMPAMTVPGAGDTARFGVANPGGVVAVTTSHTLDAILMDDVLGLGFVDFQMGPGTTLNLTGAASVASLEVYGWAQFQHGQVWANQGVVVGTSPASQNTNLELLQGASLTTSDLTVAESTAAFQNHMAILGSHGNLGTANVAGNFVASSGSTLTTSSLTVSGNLPANFDLTGASMWTGGGATVVGDQSSANMDILGGSTATLDRFDVGKGAASVADVLVANLGFGEDRTLVSANELRVGIGSSDADFQVSFGAKVSAPEIRAGVDPASVGRIELAGRQFINQGGPLVELPATLEATTELVVGEQGRGEVRVLEDGLLNASKLRAAVEQGSSALIEVRSGAGNPLGGQFTSGGQVEVGIKGAADLNVTGGGRVDVDRLSLGVDRTNVNNRGEGNLTVTGQGSQVMIQDRLVAGNQGDSRVDISASAIVTADSIVAAEQRGGPLGTTTSVIDVSGSGTLAATNRFELGQRGKAELSIRSAAFVTAHEFLAGSELGSLAEINITDPGSSLWASDVIKFGPAGFSEATIQNGGFATAPKIRLTNRGGVIAPLGSAHVVVTDDNSQLFATEELSIAGNGAATLELKHNGVARSPSVLIGIDDPVNQDGSGQKGFLTLDGGLVETAQVDIFATGTLQGNGTVANLGGPLGVDNLRGAVHPGLSGIEIEGDYTQGAAARFVAELQGTTAGTDFSRLMLDGTATLSGGVAVTLTGGFSPVFGDEFKIIRAGNGVAGTFADPMMPALSAGLGWRIRYNAQDVTLEVGNHVAGDLDFDGIAGASDIDRLIEAIANGSMQPQFDLDGDGMVTLADRDEWLVDAGNLNQGAPYLVADGNLDGTVDGLDFILWNNRKFTSTGSWSGGDWNADGFTDGLDFVLWNNNKFQSSDGIAAIPEPSVSPATMMVVFLLLVGITRRGNARWTR